MEETVQFGQDRNRRNRPSEYSRTTTQSIIIDGPDINKGRVSMTPNQRAGINLFKFLGKFENIFTEERRRELQATYEEMPQIKYMSTLVLAMVLAFLQRNPVISKASFTDSNIMPFVNQIQNFDNLATNDKRELLDRYKATMVRYIQAVQDFQKQRYRI